MSSSENETSRVAADGLFYILVGTYLVYVLVEGWHRLPAAALN
jgi:hypothetical protein